MDIAKLIILSLVCVVIGYILKSLIDALLHPAPEETTLQAQEYPQTPPAEQPEPVAVSLDGDAPQTLPDSATPRAVEKADLPLPPPLGVLIGGVSAGERPVIELDGQRLASAEALTESQRSRLSQAADDLNAWLGRPAVPSVQMTPAAVPLPEAPASPPKVETSIGTPISAAPVSSVPVPLSSAETAAKPARLSFNPVNILANALKADMPKLPARSDSLVGQVNDILQEKIQGTSLAQRGLALVEALDHSMLVVIGLERYNGIDAVPDEEIRSLIRQCVAEWSSRMAK